MYEFNNDELKQFKENKYMIIDNFLDNTTALLCQEEILNLDPKYWDRYNNCFEQKNTFRDKNSLPENVNKLFKTFTSKEFISNLNKLTGLNLINDDDKIFWGVHLFNDGDKLDIHVDAGRHLKTGLIKAVTFGIYLSYNWSQENGGYIEFWEGDKSSIDNPKIYSCKEQILPIFNRCIIFENNDTSWHGAPEPCICKNNEKRIFVTLSYLSDENSNLFENQRLKAYFVKRPNDPDDEEKDKMRILRANPETCKLIYNMNK
jgi:Rps23 Pro-64 3,4-dihydroxylase Tpa1-like proline 4-hydroxylase